MYYISYNQRKNKSKLLLYIILIIIILAILFFFIFNRKQLVLNKGLSRTYIDKLIEYKEYDKALKLLLKYVAVGENLNWWYFYKIGIIYYYLSDYLTSLLYFRNADFYSDSYKLPQDIYFYIGDNYYKLGKSYYLYAIDYFEKYLKISNPNKFIIPLEEFLYKLSIMYVDVGRYDDAYKIINKILNNFQNDYRLLYNYALTLKNLGKNKEAINYLEIIKDNTFDLDIRKDTLFLIGKIYCEIEDYKKAIEYFFLCVDISPSSDISYYYLGYCYSQLHDNKTAINYLTKAILINKNNELAKNLLKALK